MRYTPAGVAVLNVLVGHHSSQVESEKLREAIFDIQGKFVGELAYKAQAWELGKYAEIKGFLARKSVRSTQLVLHVNEFVLINK